MASIYDNIVFKTVSQLPAVGINDTIHDSSLFEIASAQINATNNTTTYTSKSITINKLSQHIVEKTKEDFAANFNLDETDTDFSFITSGVRSYLSGNSNLTVTGEHTFQESPKILDSIVDNFSDNENRVATVKTLSAYSKTNNPLFLSEGGSFSTKIFNIETHDTLTQTGIAHAPSTEVEKHNAFIFRMSGNTSTETWVCPTSGWFTCYGWVDEAARDNNHPVNRWVALEGKFVDQVTNESVWKILQFYPIVSNTTAGQLQYCSYVTFSLPVKEGLELRLRSGFNVGTNSGLFWNIRGSMTNHIANAFVGGIYSSI